MQPSDSSTSRMRGIISNTLIFIGGLVLLASAVSKLAHVPKVVAGLSVLGFEGKKLSIIATLETVSALLFLVPASRSVGLLLVSSYLGGAISAHLGHGQSILPPAIVLSMLWMSVWLRHPEVLWSVHRKACNTTPFDPARMQKDAAQG